MPVKIGAFSKADRDGYCELFQRVFALPPWNETWSVDTIAASLKRVMRRRDFVGAVARLDGRPVAYATGYRLPMVRGLFYLEQLFVDDRFQGKGIGKALFNYMYTAVKTRPFKGMILLTRPECPAGFFYDHLGFTLVFPAVMFRGKSLRYLSLRT